MTVEMWAHGTALVCSGVASCSAGSRNGAEHAERAERVIASALMTAAMLDSAALNVVPQIVWAAVLVGGALVVSVRRRLRSGRGGCGIYTPGGLVVMAALIATSTPGEPSVMPTAGHAHGGAALGWLCGALAVVHVAASAHRSRSGSRGDRAHHAAMGGSTALMALAALL